MCKSVGEMNLKSTIHKNDQLPTSEVVFCDSCEVATSKFIRRQTIFCPPFQKIRDMSHQIKISALDRICVRVYSVEIGASILRTFYHLKASNNHCQWRIIKISIIKPNNTSDRIHNSFFFLTLFHFHRWLYFSTGWIFWCSQRRNRRAHLLSNAHFWTESASLLVVSIF